MKHKFLVLMLSLIAASCGEREKKTQQESVLTHQPDSNAVKLNNKSVKLIGKVSAYNGDSLNNQLYDSAINYLDRAIGIDSLYLNAYTNKAQALQRRGSLEQALAVLSKVENMKPDFAEVIMGQGILLEKLDSMGLADKKYRQALEAYKKRLTDETKKVKVQSDIAFLYLFLEDKNRAIDEIQNLILENPTNNQLKAMEGYIKDFNRKKFIEEY